MTLGRQVLYCSLLLGTVCQFAAGQETKVLKGFVKTYKDQIPVAGVDVGIHGRAFFKTSKQGDFTLHIPAQMRTGFVVTFEVSNWIVIQPSYNGIRGSVPLPDPDAGDIILLVAKRGERAALLSDAGIETMILGATAEFENLRQRSEARVATPNLLYQPARAVIHQGSDPRDAAAIAKEYFDAWLDRTAQQLDIDRAEIEAAISFWREGAKSDLDQGLGFLYSGEIDAAISELLHVTANDHIPRSLRAAAYQAVGFGYALEGDYPAAAKMLQEGFDQTGDHNFLIHIGSVLLLDNRPEEAQTVMERARQIMEINGVAPIPDFFNNLNIPLLEDGWFPYKRAGERFYIHQIDQVHSGTYRLFNCKYSVGAWDSRYHNCSGKMEFGGHLTIRFNDNDASFEGVLKANGLYIDGYVAFKNDKAPYAFTHVISVEEAGKYRGKLVTVCGLIQDARPVGTDMDRHLELALQNRSPYGLSPELSELLQFLVEWYGKNTESDANATAKTYRHKMVCVDGKIERVKGRFSVAIHSEEDVEIVSGQVGKTR